VHFSGYAGKVTMLVRGPSLEKSMSRYLIEQIAALPNIECAPTPRRSRPRATGTSTPADPRPRRRARGGRRRRFVFIGAAPRTDWLEGVVARDERGFILAGLDAKAPAGRSSATRSCSRPRCPACSSPATCARAR
jgi:thioredoxin reductase (NADPH)